MVVRIDLPPYFGCSIFRVLYTFSSLFLGDFESFVVTLRWYLSEGGFVTLQF